MKALKKVLKGSLPVALCVTTAVQCSFVAFAQEDEVADDIQQVEIENDETTESVTEDIIDDNTFVDEEVVDTQVNNMAYLPIPNSWQQIGSRWIYVDGNGNLVKNQWVKSKGKWYYIGEDRFMVSDCHMTINGKYYLFNEDGSQHVGWKKELRALGIHYGGDWYYYLYEGNCASDFMTINGKTYFFGQTDNGCDGAEAMKDGCLLIRGNFYYFDENGVMQKNKWIQCRTTPDVWDGKANWIYVQSDGKAVKSAWKKINGKWYYFDDSARMVKDCTREINGKYYHFTESGALAVGWHKETWDFSMGDGNWWFYYYSNGDYAKDIETINGKTYFFGTPDGLNGGQGVMKTGFLSFRGTFYYFDDNGSMQKSKWIRCASNQFWQGKSNWIYLQEDGKAVTSAWKKINGKWYYFDDLARMVHDTTLTINGKKYTFDSKGVWIK